MIATILLLSQLWAAPNLLDPNMQMSPVEQSQGGLTCPGFAQCPPKSASEVRRFDNSNPASDSKQDADKGSI